MDLMLHLFSSTPMVNNLALVHLEKTEINLHYLHLNLWSFWWRYAMPFVLTLNEIMVSTTRFLPLLNAFRFRLSKDLRYLRPRSILKPLLSMKGQKRNRGARKIDLFTKLVELWNYDSHNLCSKKGLFFRAPLWAPISHGGFSIYVMSKLRGRFLQLCGLLRIYKL